MFSDPKSFIIWLVSVTALPIVADYILQGIKLLFPALEDRAASIASVAMAALANVVAILLMPYADQIPAALIPFWGTLIWIVGQVWYLLKIKKPS